MTFHGMPRWREKWLQAASAGTWGKMCGLLGFEARCPHDGSPALVIGTLNLREGFTSGAGDLETECLDADPHVGLSQRLDEDAAQGLGHARGCASRRIDREPSRGLDVEPALLQGGNVGQPRRSD